MGVTTTFSEKKEEVREHLQAAIAVLLELAGQRDMYGAESMTTKDRILLINWSASLTEMCGEL